MKKEYLAQNIWTSDDDREHPESSMEWWALEAFFTIGKSKKKFSFKADFTEWLTKKTKEKGSLFKMTLYDPIKHKTYSQTKRDEKNRLKSSKESFDISFQKSFIKGRYPNYEMSFYDEKNKIEVKLNYTAEAYPHWIAQDVTEGWLPLGLGCYRYGFVPKGKITGTMKHEGKKYKIEGFGYFEHVWGEFTYQKISDGLKGFGQSIRVYTKLFENWRDNVDLKIPDKLVLSNDNNVLGYDWFWAVLDNGWSIFYGNIMVWLMQGPIAGSVILTKDGKTYEEFYKASFKYNKTKNAECFDFFYPTEIELTAEKGSKKLHLKCKMTTEAREYFTKFSKSKYWLGLSICEAPGIIEGYYEDEKGKTKISGICKIEPQRQASVLGHNKLTIDFLKPPKGVGITFDLHSHFLKKNININLQLAPRPKLKIKTKKIDYK